MGEKKKWSLFLPESRKEGILGGKKREIGESRSIGAKEKKKTSAKESKDNYRLRKEGRKT